MPWFLVDDGFYDHPKADAAGDAAIGLWTRAGSYCQRYLTDGHVSTSALRKLRAKPAQTKALVEAGLWVKVDDGYVFHQFLERHRSKVQVEADRAAAAERQRRRRSSNADSDENEAPARRNGRQNRGRGEQILPSDAADTGVDSEGIAADHGVLSRRDSHRESRDPGQAWPGHTKPSTSLLTLAGRLGLVTARELASASLPDDVIAEWQAIAGPGVDLEDEARRYLAHHGDQPARHPRRAWLGWLGKRRQHDDRPDTGGPPLVPAPRCSTPDCVAGWLPELDDGRRPPCPTCKPHLKPVPHPEAS